jgi:hypothetical protein
MTGLPGAKDVVPSSFSASGKRRHFQKLIWRDGAGSHARREDGAFEVEGLVDARPDGARGFSTW